ncbi:MAG: HNH endonuclease signature motif containing protein [Candidatus Desantisbacteria bacterium]
MASKKQIDEAWEKVKPVSERNPDVWGKDALGNLIRKPSYGTQGEYGWEIDHKYPLSKGGTDTPKNIQPLQWKENRTKSDKYPYKKK